MIMTQGIEKQNIRVAGSYRQKFEQAGLAGKSPAWLVPLRNAAMSRFADLGFPTTDDEDWRFTNVAPISKLPFAPVLESSRGSIDAAMLKNTAFAALNASRLVFIDGHFSSELSTILPQPAGVKIGSLAAALKTDSSLVEKYLALPVPDESSAFASLNTAFFQDGAFIYVPKGKTVAEPVHLVFISTAKETGATTHPRNLIIAEDASKLTVIETYVGAGARAYFTNAVEELFIGAGAVVEHCKFQDESAEA